MLSLSLGQYSSAGEKPVNQDAIGACIPSAVQLQQKGAVLALADGISSSDVSHTASQIAVKQFLDDYYCTSETVSVKHAAEQVIQANNRWLYAQSKQQSIDADTNRGYVCTFDAVVVKHTTAYWFHLGDGRLCLLREGELRQLTHEHRYYVSEDKHYLANAIGIHPVANIDSGSITLLENDALVMFTDGVYEHVPTSIVIETISAHRHNPEKAAKMLVETAFHNGSKDNLSVQILWADSLPEAHATPPDEAINLPLPPVMEAGYSIDDYTVLRPLYHSARSHVYLVLHQPSGQQLILKAPSQDKAHDEGYLHKCSQEEWLMRRIHSQYVIKAPQVSGQRSYFYTLSYPVSGQTLAQWLLDNPQPNLTSVRDIVSQIAKGLMALHRKGVLYQDIRPENVMVDKNGTVVLIDLGAASIEGVNEAGHQQNDVPGTAIYTAPEYFLGQAGSEQSDQFSLAVLTYYLLSGEFPYGAGVAKCTSLAAQYKLSYRTVLTPQRSIPFWLDLTLKRAVHPNPLKRYDSLSEFIYDLKHPNRAYLSRSRPPLMHRNPVRFWQVISGILLLIVMVLLAQLYS